MHLSPEFGHTYKEIEKDGFSIEEKIEILLSSDTEMSIAKAMGLALISFPETYQRLAPDIIVVLGDRFEIYAATISALVCRIPVAHIHGGERTEGAIDEAMRHAITKMSHLHFTATEEYRQRVIQLGENPHRVFTVGALGLDSLSRIELLSRQEIEKELGKQFKQRNLMVTFHPATLEDNTAGQQFRDLLKALDSLKDTLLIFTRANADSGGRAINDLIDAYVQAHPDKAVAFASLGQKRYFSVLQYVDAVVGNSSSGIIEVPAFHIGTINIGDRQKGRIRSDSIIDCPADEKSIRNALEKLYSAGFQEKLGQVKNVYNCGAAAKKIAEVLKTYDTGSLLKKVFYDLPE